MDEDFLEDDEDYYLETINVLSDDRVFKNEKNEHSPDRVMEVFEGVIRTQYKSKPQQLKDLAAKFDKLEF